LPKEKEFIILYGLTIQRNSEIENQVGKTKDVGFQFGIRKTFSVSTEKVWDFLFSENGVNIWLGKLKNELEIKKEYETENGTKGLIRVFKPNSHIRLNWKPKKWKNMSTVQIRVIETGEKSTSAIHKYLGLGVFASSYQSRDRNEFQFPI